jgi:beta-1,4-mannosyltransferase
MIWFCLSALLLVYVVFRHIIWRGMTAAKRATVLVMGDIGRSPRMQYHAQSLALAGYDVDLVGLAGAAPHSDITSNPRISIYALEQFDAARVPLLRHLLGTHSSIAGAVLLGAKAASQFFLLFVTLVWTVPRPQMVLVQSPPAIPVIAVARLSSWLRGARLVIDWHNLGYSIMALGALGRRVPALVAVARAVELYGGRLADGHLAVTRALAAFLSAQNVAPAERIAVVHDQPARIFTELALPVGVAAAPEHGSALAPAAAVSAVAAAGAAVAHELFARLERDGTLEGLNRDWHRARVIAPSAEAGAARETLLTRLDKSGAPVWRSDRPAVLVSGTSWTPDEDFSVLLAGLQRLDATIAAQRAAAQQGAPPAADVTLPDVLIVVTGRGPLRETYVTRFRTAQLRHCHFTTAWLRAEDYPRLLRVADAGVSLHCSSSGLDLPMKVVDMFGVALPVCAVAFACLSELVRDGENGLVFADAEALATQLARLLSGFPAAVPTGDIATAPLLVQLRARLLADVGTRQWQRNWEMCAAPALGVELCSDDLHDQRGKRHVKQKCI